MKFELESEWKPAKPNCVDFKNKSWLARWLEGIGSYYEEGKSYYSCKLASKCANSKGTSYCNGVFRKKGKKKE